MPNLTTPKKYKTPLLQTLATFPASSVYELSSSKSVERGYQYYQNSHISEIEWSDDGKEISLLVESRNHYTYYEVVISHHAGQLNYFCDCMAWTTNTHCKHVVACMFMIVHLLNPERFSETLFIDDDNLDELYQQLTDEPVTQDIDITAITHPDKIALILSTHKEKLRVDAYQHNQCISASNLPKKLAKLITANSNEECAKHLKKVMNSKKYQDPLYFNSTTGLVPLEWQKDALIHGHINIHITKTSMRFQKLAKRENKPLESLTILANLFAIDLHNHHIYQLGNTSAWDIMHRCYPMQPLLFGFGIPNENIKIPDRFNIDFEQFNHAKITIKHTSDVFSYIEITQDHQKPLTPKILHPRINVAITSGDDKNYLAKTDIQCFLGDHEMDLDSSMNFLHQVIRSDRSFRKKQKSHTLAQIILDLWDIDEAEAETFIDTSALLLTSDNYNYHEVKTSLYEFYEDCVQMSLEQIFIVDDTLVRVPINLKHYFYACLNTCLAFDINLRELLTKRHLLTSQELIEQKVTDLYQNLRQSGITMTWDNKTIDMAELAFEIDASNDHEEDWFAIHPNVIKEGKSISKKEWDSLLAGMLRWEQSDKVELVDPKHTGIINYFQHLSPSKHSKIVHVPRLEILEWIELEKRGVTLHLSAKDSELLNKLKHFNKIDCCDKPQWSVHLRDYQNEGYDWLAFLYEHRFGACLADDMGLGKTLQSLAFLVGLHQKKVTPRTKAKKPHLIVMPPSLVFNWRYEIDRFYPHWKVNEFTGPNRQWDNSADIVLTSYDTLRNDVEKFKTKKFHVLIFDEAQVVKNIQAKKTSAARQLHAEFRIALTGTPLENHIGEYYSIIDLVLPGLLGDYPMLKKKKQDESYQALIKKTQPFVLRRTKEAILAELPEKTETDIYLDLSKEQKALYSRMVGEIREEVRQAFKEKTRSQAGIVALTALLRLRQICVAAQLIDPKNKGKSPKMEYLKIKLKELIDDGHSVLVFSQFIGSLTLIEDSLKSMNILTYRMDGNVPIPKRKQRVSDFQTGKEASVFLISLKTGGVGLNLTRANYVFHVDPWWNPAVENQASDRAHRIGQPNKVFITRLLMRHSVEEKMMQLKKTKTKLFETVMQGSTNRDAGISKDDFEFLLND